MIRFEAYTKLFHRILQSSVWDLDDRTRIVWITLLAMTDSNGSVISTVKFVAKMARLDRTDQDVEDVRRAIERFSEPDLESLTEGDEGRRLVRIEGGWQLINFKKYQEMMKQEARRETWRESKSKHRAKGKKKEWPIGVEKRHQQITEEQGEVAAAEYQDGIEAELSKNRINGGESI
jgi:hypothetical protein